ncbi:MAG: bifunctional acetate--CoA ligase family protein/GNAT family N-acetyltransferase [Chlamydiota bacterium]
MVDVSFDPSQNYLARPQHPLHSFFSPRSVAIIGAKEQEGSVGRTLLTNMMASFKGKIYPVNPKYPQVLGVTAYPRIQDIPDTVDLGIIVTPAALIPGLIDDCVAARVKSVIIISAGFKETGEEGLKLEQEVLKRARVGGIRIIGPNCLGLMNPSVGLNATFAASMALDGQLAFISQSGALCTAVLDWSLKERVGFSAFVSIGSMADIQWGDLIDYFANDPKTRSILIYMETVGDARTFLSAAREASFTKPIILIKPGRTEAAAKAAASHTGSLAGADDVFDAAIRRGGLLRVDEIHDLFNMADVLGRQPVPKGPRLAIVTNAGGPAVLATDATLMHGAEMAELHPVTMEKLNSFLPSAWSHNNPVDILGDAGADRYAKSVEEVSKDPNVDGILIILTPQDMTDSTATAEALKKAKERFEKPVLASWMGASFVEKGIEILNHAGIPTFSYPDSAAKTFALMWMQSDRNKLLYETPMLVDKPEDLPLSKVKEIKQYLETLKKEKRTLLTEAESKKVLAAYGIPVVQTVIAETMEEAVAAAEKMGYPVVMKLHSETITHKSDVGGVKLNIRNKEGALTAYQEIQESVTRLCGKEHFQGVTVQQMVSVSDGYEIIIGSIVDPQFGPVVLFGTGGQLVEIFKDRAIGIPPFTSILADRLMQRTKIYEALHGVRGKKPVDLKKLEEILVEQPRILECDINPLIVSSDQVIALDARFVLHDWNLADADLPKPAIRPYPIEYITTAKIKNGTLVHLRPIRPEDEPLLISFHKELSDETIRSRYFEFMSLEERTAHERLIQICHSDYDREITLVAETEGHIVGIARYSKIYGTPNVELKLTIIDKFQHQGLGTKMLEKIIAIATQENIAKISMNILNENDAMIHLCKKFKFTMKPTEDSSIICGELSLGANK